VHFFSVGGLHVVHLQALDGVLGSEGVTHSAGVALDDSVGVVGVVRLGTLFKFTVKTLAVCADSLRLLRHC
jgi:hypothetical protein